MAVTITLDTTSKRNLCGCGCMQCCCPGILIEDHFVGDDADPINFRLPDTHNIGTFWANLGGSGAIDSNTAAMSTGNNQMVNIYHSAPGTAAHPLTISADIILGNASDNVAAGIVFRASNDLDYWVAAIVAKNVTNPTTRLDLVEVTGGVATVRDSRSHGFSVNTTYSLVVTLEDSLIVATADGTGVSSWSSTRSTVANAGIYSTCGDTPITRNRADNLKIECT